MAMMMIADASTEMTHLTREQAQQKAPSMTSQQHLHILDESYRIDEESSWKFPDELTVEGFEQLA